MVVVREAHPAVAVTAEGLRGKEGGAGDRAEGTGLSPLVFAAEGLGGVLDDGDDVPGGDGLDRVVIRGKAEEVDGDDGAGAKSAADGAGQRVEGRVALFDGLDGLLQLRRVDVEGGGIDVHEDRRRAEEADHLGGCDEGEGGREDGVARTDLEGHERHQEGVGARGAADGMLHADVGGERRFQFPDLRAVDVLAVGENPGDVGVQFFRNAPLLGGQVDKIHLFFLSLFPLSNKRGNYSLPFSFLRHAESATVSAPTPRRCGR